MEYKKRSILSDILDYDIYFEIKRISKRTIYIYTIVLFVLILLSQFLYWSIINEILSLMLGTTIFFLIYLLALIISFDKRVEIPDSSTTNRKEYAEAQKAYRRNRNKILIIMFFSAIIMYIGECYSDDYNFKCMDVYVEDGSSYYHVIDNCDDIDDKANLQEIKGIDAINNHYKLCLRCNDFIFDADAESSVPSRYR